MPPAAVLKEGAILPLRDGSCLRAVEQTSRLWEEHGMGVTLTALSASAAVSAKSKKVSAAQDRAEQAYKMFHEMAPTLKADPEWFHKFRALYITHQEERQKEVLLMAKAKSVVPSLVQPHPHVRGNKKRKQGGDI